MRNAARALDSKVAVVTGASSGLGSAVAVAMAEAGAAAVVVVGRNEAGLRSTADSIDRAGGTSHVVRADLARDDGPQEVIARAVEAFGNVDVLVHAAGVFVPASFVGTSLAALDQHWTVNVKAPFALTQAALPYLRPGSAIIFFSSVAGRIGATGLSAYCATKGAVEQLVRALAVELAPSGIRVNAIAPGTVRTPMNEHLLASREYEQRVLAGIPAGRLGTAEETAACAVFLASDAAKYIHGVSIPVDGGRLAR